MDIGNIGLGLGSNNMLNGDLIKKLKASQEKAQLSVFKTRTTDINTKKDNLKLIDDSLNTLTSSFEELGNIDNYNAFNLNGNKTVDLKITDSKLVPDNFSLDITTKARGTIIQSNPVSDLNTQITSDQTLVFSVGNTGNRTINFSAGDTVQDIVDRLNNEAGLNVEEIKVSATQNRIVLKSEKTGVDNAINIVSDTSELNSLLGFSDATNEKVPASNAIFNYNGIAIERDSNKVDDVVPGLSFNITSVGSNDISLSHNSDALGSSIQSFVDNYNKTVDTIKKTYDTKSYSDSLQMNSEVKNILRSINNKLNAFRSTEDGKFNSLASIGLEMNKDGHMSINPITDKFGDTITLAELTSTNFDDIKDLFANPDNGIMSATYDTALTYLNKSKGTGILVDLNTQFDNKLENLNTQLEKTQTRIDYQYKLMTSRFIAFEGLISNATNDFSSLQLQIDQSTANTKS